MKDRGEASRNRIRGGLMQMIEENQVTRMTTSALIQKAHISRSTFYTYFNNIEDALNDLAMETSMEIIGIIRKGRAPLPGIKGYREAYRQLLEYMYQHKRLFQTLFQNAKFETFSLQMIAEYLYDLYQTEYPSMEDHVLEYSALASTNFVYSMLKKWASEGYQSSIDEMTDIFMGSLQLAVKIFL